MRDRPSDDEVLDLIIPVLIEYKKAGQPTIEATGPAVDAVMRRWPNIGLHQARARVTRLRIL